jgi:hypothetical protein
MGSGVKAHNRTEDSLSPFKLVKLQRYAKDFRGVYIVGLRAVNNQFLAERVNVYVCVILLFYSEFDSHVVTSIAISVTIQDHLAPINCFSRNFLAFFFLFCYVPITILNPTLSRL